MKSSWHSVILPPVYLNYELTQKARLLYFMMVIAFLGAILTGISNYLNGWQNEAISLFLFAFFCMIGFILNQTRHLNLAAMILSVTFFIVINFMLINGIGLYDETVYAIPAFIICTTFLFGRRGLWLATIASVITVVSVHFFQEYALFVNEYPPAPLRATILIILVVLTALIILTVRNSWKTNLLHMHDAYDLTLQGWARALEYRNGETAGHTRRVAELSIKLARKLGVSEHKIPDIRRGAYLHDIGKMAIPDKILFKPDSLDEEEWETMKQHPIFSREFISDIKFLRPAMQIAYYHHERWDGTGYPEGLQGEAIPLYARIFAVIDNWDALNSNRPYRKAWPSEDVIAYLQGNAGSIFDPQIVEAFLEILKVDEMNK